MTNKESPDVEMAFIAADLLMICVTLATISAAHFKGGDTKYLDEKFAEVDKQLQDAMNGISKYVKRV